MQPDLGWNKALLGESAGQLADKCYIEYWKMAKDDTHGLDRNNFFHL